MSALLALTAIALMLIAALPHAGDPRKVLRWRPLRLRGHRDVRAALPTLVDALAAALGSGLSLTLAFAEVAPTLPPRLGSATRRVASALALGARVQDALTAYGDVVPPEDLAPVAVVLASFARTGGRVGASLERVARLLRGRLALEEERAALTAQARASALVLIALAPLGAGFFAIAMPDYLSTPFPYAYGGAEHAETILESCLAVAELRLDDMAGPHNQQFMARLAASISRHSAAVFLCGLSSI